MSYVVPRAHADTRDHVCIYGINVKMQLSRGAGWTKGGRDSRWGGMEDVLKQILYKSALGPHSAMCNEYMQ